MSKAQSIFESESNLKLQVTVFWGSSCPSKRNEKNISEALAREVLKQLSINSPMGRLNSPQFDEPILQYSLEGISYFSLGENGSSCWSSPLALFPGSATNRMQMVLDEKEPKLLNYRKSCSRLWLLVVSNKLYFTSEFLPENGFLENCFKSSFDQVFVLDEAKAQIRELKLGKVEENVLLDQGK